jgi:hypothetical protein
MMIFSFIAIAYFVVRISGPVTQYGIRNTHGPTKAESLGNEQFSPRRVAWRYVISA